MLFCCISDLFPQRKLLFFLPTTIPLLQSRKSFLGLARCPPISRTRQYWFSNLFLSPGPPYTQSQISPGHERVPSVNRSLGLDRASIAHRLRSVSPETVTAAIEDGEEIIGHYKKIIGILRQIKFSLVFW